MPPFSKRRPTPVELPLGTGDFEAVAYDDRGQSAPRTPIYHRSLTPQQDYGYGHSGHPSGHQSGHQGPSGHYRAAPTSLSPVAMAARLDPNGTGPHQAVEADGSRPTMRTGFAILLAGTLIGAVIGITTRVRQNDGDLMAAAAQQAQMVQADPAFVAPSPPPTPAPTVIGPTGAIPAAPASASVGTTMAPSSSGSVVIREPKKAHGSKLVAGATPPAHAALAKVVAPPKEKEAAKDKDDDGYKTASAEPGSAKKSEPEPKEAKAPAKDAKSDAKEAKAEPKESKKATKGGSKASDDAVNVLKAAMGATENTL